MKSTHIRVLRSCMFSVALYVTAEHLVPTLRTDKALIYPLMLRILWVQNMSNEKVLNLIHKQKKLLFTIKIGSRNI